ncbi:hypothetical protein GBF38_009193 [Nibea albiflora]|uniref:Uncharacterized protein n=1 Tax=Nibea albiflora TaxID=240163 RepID=A0ACB7EPZ0_NIBAL|nr:hypothetical protein GBF38_009193 [Nibea albiflora]
MIRLPLGSALGFSVLPEDSSTGGQEGDQTVDNSPCLLNHSRPFLKCRRSFGRRWLTGPRAEALSEVLILLQGAARSCPECCSSVEGRQILPANIFLV